MNKIEKFQQLLVDKNIDAYIIPTSDYHGSEYVSDYFKGRKYLSGFTGSAGTLVITKNDARLWTDGRYHIQAALELEGSKITLMKDGNKDVPTIGQYLNSILKDKNTLAFDGRVLGYYMYNYYTNPIKANINVVSDIDLINEVWESRPELPFSILYMLDEFFTGCSYKKKLEKIKAKMNEYQTNVFILSSLEDQAWLYNLRGNDVLHTPVFLAYTVITDDNTYLYVDSKKIDDIVTKYLEDNDIIVKPYFEFYDAIKNIKDKKILIDYSKINYTIYKTISDEKNKNKLVNKANPTLLLKAIKNDVEIEHIKEAHIKDGVAVTRFMKYLKENSGQTEISLSDYLANLRASLDGFIDLSFETICAYKEHAAMMHYSANANTNIKVEGNGMLLVDSGGHYLDGTTDITRTFGIGNPTKKMKDHFTIVLKSVIALSSVVFLRGVNGVNLDVLARGPIWKELIDYKCGTGHGVGNILSVHEGPNAFRWQNTVPCAIFTEGMITTNEPGIYLEGKYGIRTENEMLCVSKGKSEFGEFLGFETITYAPIDLDLISPTLLNKEEKKWLNNYHKMVFDTLSPRLNAEEVIWLKEYTREIK